MRSLVQVPDHDYLRRELPALLTNSAGSGRLTILSREPNAEASTFLSEVVTCLLPDGRELRLLCKYSNGRGHNDHGHRGGIAYEAAVYREVLQPLRTSTPRFIGAYTDPSSGDCLVLEYLDEDGRGTRPRDMAAMILAAEWIGRFHAANQSRACEPKLNFLIAYDAAYYQGWADRTQQFAGHWHERLPWLALVCQRFDQVIPVLLAEQPTIIHGEYYRENILERNGVVYPVDWESAAVGAGVIDLVSLTEGWTDEIEQSCREAYCHARWPTGAPADFDHSLNAARLYLNFRWLGDWPAQTLSERSRWRFEDLRIAAERLGLI